MANTKKKKLSKKELKEKDQILTNLEKGWGFLEKHSVKVVGVLVGAVVVTGIWAIWGHFSHKSDAEASRMFNKALRAYNKPVIPESPEGKEKKGKEPKSYPTEAKRAKAALGLFKKLVSEHGGNPLAHVANFYMGNCYFQLKQYDKAVSFLKKYLAGGNSGCSGGTGELSPALKLVALENLAYSYEGKKDYDKALSYFTRLEKAESGMKKEWSLYHQARMWELKGEIQKAIQLYQSVKVADPYAAMSPLRVIAEKRALYLKNGLGAPAGGKAAASSDKQKSEKKAPLEEEKPRDAVGTESPTSATTSTTPAARTMDTMGARPTTAMSARPTTAMGARPTTAMSARPTTAMSAGPTVTARKKSTTRAPARTRPQKTATPR